jgi:penicillin-binding protein 1A
MTSLLKKTVEVGTLASGSGWGSKFSFRDEAGTRYRIPAAGKTGTTQNWSDAWTVGYTPYYTTAIWFGFDKPGNSLGLSLTGATLAGPVWGDYMREIHLGLPMKDFGKPATGIIEVPVCAETGLLKTSACPNTITLPFLEGTQPTIYCGLHENVPVRSVAALETLRTEVFSLDDADMLQDLKMPELRLDLLPSAGGVRAAARNAASRQSAVQRQNTPSQEDIPDIPESEPGSSGVLEIPSYNPLLD